MPLKLVVVIWNLYSLFVPTSCVHCEVFMILHSAAIYSRNCFLLIGPPGDISDVIIPPDTITACSFVVQWSRPSSDPVCGLVWYTVTVTTGGMSIINDSTTRTDYNVTGLNSTTTYIVNVNANNNAGSSSSTIMSIMTDNNGESVTGMYLDLFEEFLY